MIGEKIKSFRKQKKLTQDQLGQLVDLSGVAIMRYEKGQREPNRETIEKIATALEVTPSQIYGWDEKYNKDGQLAQDVKQYEQFEKVFNSDMGNMLKFLIEQLEGDNHLLKFEGIDLDDELREVLKNSLSNIYDTAKILNKK